MQVKCRIAPTQEMSQIRRLSGEERRLPIGQTYGRETYAHSEIEAHSADLTQWYTKRTLQKKKTEWTIEPKRTE